MVCTSCGSKVPFDRDRCPTCGRDAGFPNVREVSMVAEKDALHLRYQAKLKSAAANGTDNQVAMFEDAVKGSHAVISVDMDYLLGFFLNEKALYSTYRLMVDGDIRKTASSVDDKRRCMVEGGFFGSYAAKIRYAALSIDGKGPASYGSYTMVLKDVAVRDRATLLEENSYVFFEKHKARIPHDFPAGYRSVWEERHKLAVAKLADRISGAVPPENYPEILLSSSGDRKTDDFIEVHIYDLFDNNAIESVVIDKNVAKKARKTDLARLKEALVKKGIKCIEV